MSCHMYIFQYNLIKILLIKKYSQLVIKKKAKLKIKKFT